jgi:predicted Fe-Mo cluster-binding NifX family protein
MLIWVPVEERREKESKIAKVMEAKAWALINFDAGIIQSIEFYDRREDFNDFADFIILENKFENFMEYMNEGLVVLSVRDERTIDEIIEAFKFKELDEVGF